MTAYAEKERARHWPVSAELMAQYRDGSHDRHSYRGLEWHQNGLVHRDGDKPAMIYPDGRLEWYQNNQRHRDGDKPAYIDADGALVWYQNGKLHRCSGPAAICSYDKLFWYINDEDITQEVRKWLNRKPWRGTPEQIFEFQLRFL